MTHRPEEGDTHAVERSFTADDVAAFADVSRDTQPIHTEREPPVVHGLLTATLCTEIGGDLEVLAHTMAFEFLEPVYAGDTIRCEWTASEVDEREDRYDLVGDVACRRIESEAEGAAADKVVLEGRVEGVVWKE